MTIIFRLTQKCLSFLGLLFARQESVGLRVRRCISIIMISSLLQPMLAFLSEHRHDVIKATEVLIQLSAEVMTLSKVAFFCYNRRYVLEIIENLQNNFNEKAQQRKLKELQAAEREIRFVSKMFCVLLVLAGIAYTGGPLFLMIYNYFNGTFTPDLRVHPFRAIYIFNYESSPGFELVYIINIAYNFYIAMFYAGLDLLFMALSLHIIASLKVLENDFMDIDDVYQKPITNKRIFCVNRNKNPDKQFEKGFIKLLNEHYKILENVERFATIESGIIFMQFFGVVIVLSTILFQVQMKGNDLVYWMPGIAVLAQLFSYCYYGNQLTEQLCQLADVIYQLKWYNYPIRYQKYIAMIMVRAQQFEPISGMGFVTCSLESFADILRMVASVAALFKSFNE